MKIRDLLLEKLKEAGRVPLEAFFPRNYPETRLWRRLLGLDSDYRFSRKSLSVILSQLQREGLVECQGRSSKATWQLTSMGERRVHGASDPIRRLVIFDIPERERRKRDAIRTELAAAGYTQLQKSVWAGSMPLPEDFMELYEDLRLKGKVHIFSVRDAGTLRNK